MGLIADQELTKLKFEVKVMAAQLTQLLYFLLFSLIVKTVSQLQ